MILSVIMGVVSGELTFYQVVASLLFVAWPLSHEEERVISSSLKVQGGHLEEPTWQCSFYLGCCQVGFLNNGSQLAVTPMCVPIHIRTVPKPGKLHFFSYTVRK